MAIEITDNNFDELSANGQLMVVDFWAQWCGPCKSISPIIDELSVEYDGRAVVGKVDIEENPDICEKFAIRNIPTIFFVKNGEVIDKIVGAVGKDKIVEKIEGNI